MAATDHYSSLPGEEVGGGKGQMVFTGKFHEYTLIHNINCRIQLLYRRFTRKFCLLTVIGEAFEDAVLQIVIQLHLHRK